MKILLGVLTVIVLFSSACERQSVEEPEDYHASRKLNQTLRQNFAGADWIDNIERISVRGDKIYVWVDLLNHSDKARTICNEVSSLIYADSPADKEKIIIRNPRGRTLTERNGISARCW
jgi:ribosomal protein S28E/S33